jgi:hypothetical protein
MTVHSSVDEDLNRMNCSPKKKKLEVVEVEKVETYSAARLIFIGYAAEALKWSIACLAGGAALKSQ